MAAQEESVEAVPVKKESLMGFVIALVVLSLVALAGGWFMAGQLNSSSMTAKKEQVAESSEKKDEENNTENEAIEKTEAIILDPIIIALRKSENAFMRMELAVIPDQGSDIDSQENRLRIASDIAAFAQTLTLEQISGPSGYLHFREDILDRVRLITDGQVDDVLIMSLVAE